MSNVLIVDDIVKEYLPGYENVTRFMRLFYDYFVDQYNRGEFNYWQSKKFYTLIKYLRERLPKDLKTNHKRALSFVKNFRKLETYYNRTKNVKFRERAKIKLITYWPFAKALEDRKNLRISQEREAERKRADDEYKQYLLNDPKEKRKREVEEKKNLEFLERINRQDEEKEKKQKREREEKEKQRVIKHKRFLENLEQKLEKRDFDYWQNVDLNRAYGMDEPPISKNRGYNIDYSDPDGVINFVLNRVIKDEPPKLKKLFIDYIKDIYYNFFVVEGDTFIGSYDFRIDYPKLYKYLDKHLSVTEAEKVKLFKIFNKLDDILVGRSEINDPITWDDKFKFFILLPYYSVLVGREEKKKTKSRNIPKRTHVAKLSIDTFAKASRKFNSFFNFATNEMLGGIYNDYPEFLVLFAKYLKSYFYSSSDIKLLILEVFVQDWKRRNQIQGYDYMEYGKLNETYTNLVEFLKNFLKDTPKQGRNSLINGVYSITDKLRLFEREDITGRRKDHFAFLALQLLVYAPFADAYLQMRKI